MVLEVLGHAMFAEQQIMIGNAVVTTAGSGGDVLHQQKKKNIDKLIEDYTTQEEKKYQHIRVFGINKNFILTSWVIFLTLILIKCFLNHHL